MSTFTAAGRRRRVRLLAATLAAGVAGCSGALPFAPASEETPAAPADDAGRTAPRITTVPPPTPETAARPPATVEPEHLLGLDSEGLYSALGAPVTVETDGSAQIWHYALGDCLLRLYLYADIGTGARRTLRYHADPAPGSAADCTPPLKGDGADDRG